MELRYLEIFCKVFEKRSFSKAADSLFLTQPTVSSHIKALEDEIEIKLFDRLGREITPTKAGELLYGYAQKVVRLKEEAKQALQQFSGSIKGNLEIGGSTIPGEYLLPAIIGRFKVQYPEIKMTLRIGDTKEVTQMVIDGEVELGVVGAEPEDNRIESMELQPDELILVAHAAYEKESISDKGFNNIPLILREAGSGSRTALEKTIEKMGLTVNDLNVIAEMGSAEAAKQAVKCGLGLSVISRLAVKDEIAGGRMKEVIVKGLPIKRNFYIITHRLKAKSPICKAFIDFISPSP